MCPLGTTLFTFEGHNPTAEKSGGGGHGGAAARGSTAFTFEGHNPTSEKSGGRGHGGAAARGSTDETKEQDKIWPILGGGSGGRCSGRAEGSPRHPSSRYNKGGLKGSLTGKAAQGSDETEGTTPVRKPRKPQAEGSRCRLSVPGDREATPQTIGESDGKALDIAWSKPNCRPGSENIDEG